MKFSVHNQWRVDLNDITESGGVTILNKDYKTKTSKIQTEKLINRFCSNFHSVVFLGLLHSQTQHKYLNFILL